MGALGFLVRRVGICLVLLLLLTLITFVLFVKIPSEPAGYLVDVQRSTPAEIAHARHLLGADQPIWTQYAKYVWRLAHADFGRDWQTSGISASGEFIPGAPVRGELWGAAGVTASLVFGGALVLLLVSVPLGTLAASRPNSFLDRLITGVSLVGISTHPLVVALLAQLFFAKRWHIFPINGYCPLHKPPGYLGVEACNPGVVDWVKHLILPWITFALFFVALYARVVRARMIEILREPFIRTARAKGASPGRVVRRHALPNAWLPIVTMIGMDVGTAIGVAVYIETVFNLPGLGYKTVQAIATGNLNVPVVVGIVFFSGAAIMLINLLLDLLYAVIDPRIADRGRRVAAGPAARVT
ncbi:MAG: peptide/nickel transport system permease protein [Gaiellaceae bacterium]|jgi:peptide/nickel transport system permease protein|nr:peptide/nickel transport system permease protein [Gaiellaceae bacterium]